MHGTPPATIGRFLKQLRERAQLTHRQVAEHLGVHPTLVSRWETGSRGLEWDRAVVLLELYDATPAERHLATQLPRKDAA